MSNGVSLLSRSEGSLTIGWVSDPNGRGTFSLIASCVLTMGLCVWTAMHLNLPPKNSSQCTTWLRTSRWALTGIFAPELVLFVAWRQYISAKVLLDNIREYGKVLASGCIEDPKYQSAPIHSNENRPSMPWTMIHGFYAGMGGFVFELDFTDEEAAFYGTRNPPLIITSRGIALLAACGHLPDIRKEDIVDKSKSDSIAKSVVCLQAGWMIVQILGRLALGLPITLLEINTLGHILCALIIYLLWWHKPQTISEPTRLSGPWVKSLYAYMYVSSKIDDAGSHYYGIESSTDILDNTYAQPILRHGPNRLNVDEVASSRNSTKYSVQLKKNMKFENDSLGTQTDIETSLSPSSSQLRRWDLAAEAVSQYPAIRSKFNVRRNNAADVEMTIWLEPSENKMEDLITSHVGNWPSAGLLRGIGGLIMGMILWFASVAYGGVHATAWNGHFPSEVELWSWRFSSIYVIFSGLLWLLINMLAQIFKQIDRFWDRIVARQESRISYAWLGVLCFIGGLTYVLARVFLVVEAFISIRQLPRAAYDTPDWTRLVPHL